MIQFCDSAPAGVKAVSLGMCRGGLVPDGSRVSFGCQRSFNSQLATFKLRAGFHGCGLLCCCVGTRQTGSSVGVLGVLLAEYDQVCVSVHSIIELLLG